MKAKLFIQLRFCVEKKFRLNLSTYEHLKDD